MSIDYLNPQIVNQLDNLYLKAKTIVEGYMSGINKSPYHGFSVEFSEHRPYGIGDEVKNVDWKIWSKTDKLYVKRFEEETNLISNIFLDTSRSMAFSSNGITKFEYSKMIASALSYLMIKQKDAVRLYAFDSKINLAIPPKGNRTHLNNILTEIEKIKLGEDTNISQILHLGAEKNKKRGLIILISDLFDDPIKIMTGLKHFRHNGHEVIVFHILDQQEINLNFNKRTRFQDLETGDEIITDPWHIKNDYKKNMKKFCDYYKIQCRQNKIDYVMLTTNISLDVALSEYLLKRKKMN